MDDGKVDISLGTMIRQILLRCTLAIGIPALLLLLVIGYGEWSIFRKLPEVDALAAEYLEAKYPGYNFVAEPAHYCPKMECYVVEVHDANNVTRWFYLAYTKEDLTLDADTGTWYLPAEEVEQPDHE